jgi:hypothetical protein
MQGPSSIRSGQRQGDQELFEDDARVQDGVSFEIEVRLQEHVGKAVDAGRSEVGMLAASLTG